MATQARRPPKVEPRCNLTLTRAEWSVLVSLLDRVPHPIAAQVKIAIGDAIRDSDGAASFGIDRDCEKWSTVLNLVWNEGMKRRDTRDVCGKMNVQLSAAQFTRDW